MTFLQIFLQETTHLPLQQGILETAIYSLIGLAMAVLAFKVVDWLTPGRMSEQIAKEGNIALAVLAGLMIVGVCIIIAAAIS